MTDLVPAGAALDRATARREELRAKVADAIATSRAPNTERAYRSDLADFATWCEAIGTSPLPAQPGAVAAYAADMAAPSDDRPPLKVTTITRRLAAISSAHQAAGLASPTLDPVVKETMAGIRRALRTAPDRKAAVSTDQVRAVVAEFGVELADDRDRALLLLGFAGGFRRSELVALDAEDLEDHPGGLLVHIRRSKTDQEGRGRRVEVVYGHHADTCPVRAVRRWQDAAGITSGPLFRSLTRGGKLRGRLTAQSVALVVKRRIGGLGLGQAQFAGHSLRRGHATTASAGGASNRSIMRTSTGHRSERVLDGYVADAEVFTDPASGYLDL